MSSYEKNIFSYSVIHHYIYFSKRVKNLKEQLQTITTKHKSDEQTWNNKLNELMSALDKEKSLTQAEIEQRQKLEAALQESQNILQKLKTKVSSLENNGHSSGEYEANLVILLNNILYITYAYCLLYLIFYLIFIVEIFLRHLIFLW